MERHSKILDVCKSDLRKLFPTDLLIFIHIKNHIETLQIELTSAILEGLWDGNYLFSLITSSDAPSVQATSLKWRSKLIS